MCSCDCASGTSSTRSSTTLSMTTRSSLLRCEDHRSGRKCRLYEAAGVGGPRTPGLHERANAPGVLEAISPAPVDVRLLAQERRLDDRHQPPRAAITSSTDVTVQTFWSA